MSDLRVVIVDDEPLSRRALRQQLDACGHITVVAECEDVHEARIWLDHVDAMFLDIEMQGTSGLAFARTLEHRVLPAIVFVTAFDEYAVPAFATNAIDYLCKPVALPRLQKSLARISAHVRASLDGPAPLQLTARVGAREEFIPMADIECVEADGVYACVVVSGRRMLVRHSMAALEQMLPVGEFVRVHRSWIVRRAQVRVVRAARGGTHRELVLRNGLQVPVSRRRLAAVMRAIRGDARTA